MKTPEPRPTTTVERPTQTEQFVVICTEYRHSKTGKLMRAVDYGYKCWRFLVKGQKRKKP